MNNVCAQNANLSKQFRFSFQCHVQGTRAPEKSLQLWKLCFCTFKSKLQARPVVCDVILLPACSLEVQLLLMAGIV